jgi:hypothetical protein
MCRVTELTIVTRTVSMRDAIHGPAASPWLFAVREGTAVHPVWAADLVGHAFSQAKTAMDVTRVRASLRNLYQSSRPVLDALADESFWPGAIRPVRLEDRDELIFHPSTRTVPTRYVQTFAVVSVCASGKHVRGSFDGDVCPTGLAWNADEPV